MSKGMDDYKAVAQALSGQAVEDGQLFDSVSALANKLDLLNRLGGLFEGVSFSPAAEELLNSCSVAS